MITPERLRQIRLARGLSQDQLVSKMGDLVTKSALSLYEKGASQPRSNVVLRLARALDVKPEELSAASPYSVQFIAFRRKSGMSKATEESIKSKIAFDLERRVRLEQLIHPGTRREFPFQDFLVNEPADAEDAALAVRDWMGLGRDAIGNVTETLEAHGVHVFAVETSEKFDGISAVVKRADGGVISTGIAVRSGVPGERQRLTEAHEAGHLFVKLGPNVLDDKLAEKVAFRFGGAFILPAETLREEVGKRRNQLNVAELLEIKKRYGISIAALIMRMRDLNIITAANAEECFKSITRRGWRTSEPNPCPEEESRWLRQNVLRAHSEGLLTTYEAEQMVGEKIGGESSSLARLKALRALPIEERNRVLLRETTSIADMLNDDLMRPANERELTAFTALDGVDPLYLGE